MISCDSCTTSWYCNPLELHPFFSKCLGSLRGKKWHGRASSASVLLARQAHFLHPDLCRFPLEITWNDHEQSDVHRLLGSMRPIFIIWLVVSTCFTPSEKYESQVPASLRATPTHHFRQHPEITHSSHFGRSLWATRKTSLWATQKT